MPRHVCVRSLVPKLKNCAVCAISSAVSAPRGTSIIVPDQIIQFHALFLHHFLRHAMDDFDLEVEFLLETDERNHDFRFYLDAGFLDFGSGFKYRPRLHFGNFRIDDAEPAAAETEHRIELVQFLHALLNLLNRHAHFLGQIILRRVVMREEFMQRRIQEANGRRQTFQFLEDADEILLLVGQNFGQGFFPVFQIVGQNHFAHGVNAVALKEHVLGAAEANAGGPERERIGRLFGCVGIGADLEPGDF